MCGSWHDDAAIKWRALQSWRQEFKLQHGREPRLWLDKCCINQNDIATNLACLPIFLAGCKSMVVCLGPNRRVSNGFSLMPNRRRPPAVPTRRYILPNDLLPKNH